MALAEVIAQLIARKMVSNMEAKKEARNEAIARGEYTPPPKVNIFKNFWDLDDKKTKGQATITALFFAFIMTAMDAVIILPFSGNEEAAGILGYVERFPPSLFVGVALVAVVMMGRDMAVWQKASLVIFTAGGGYYASVLAPIVALVFLLQQPVKGAEAAEQTIAAEPAVVPEPVAMPEPALAPVVDIQTAEVSAAPAPVAAPKLPDDAERPEDYVDPLAEFIKK